ncbi:MAG TPA: calcium-binding protein [Burkholderiales bacterium]|nr:calcium-binding protein [Burkholderiales bacterium]
MAKPKRPAPNRVRERRIEQEIVVDAYNEEERAIGWHCYLDGKLRFPFKAKCIAAREISPLKIGEEVEVLGMAPSDDCMKEMLVIVGFAGRTFGVPLVQLDPVKPDKATREAVEDWRYWMAMAYGF